MISEHVLTRRAIEVREYLCSDVPGQHLGLLKRFPRGCCKVASLLLLQWLYEEERASGLFGVANGERPNPATPNEYSSHFWLEQADLIIDITTDQFPDGPGAVFVSSNRTWHDTFCGTERYEQSSLIPLTGWHLDEYHVMAESLR